MVVVVALAARLMAASEFAPRGPDPRFIGMNPPRADQATPKMTDVGLAADRRLLIAKFAPATSLWPARTSAEEPGSA
jgi:hypothetical protein